jgi:hypothetical protein
VFGGASAWLAATPVPVSATNSASVAITVDGVMRFTFSPPVRG